MTESAQVLKTKCRAIVDIHATPAVSNKNQQELFLEAIAIGKGILTDSHYTNQDILSAYKLQCLEYDWADELKHYCILLRDVFFRTFKSNFVPGALGDLSLISKTLESASSSMINTLGQIEHIENIDNTLAQVREHQYSPADTILVQISKIEEQIAFISEVTGSLKGIERDILFYKTELSNCYDDNLKSIAIVKSVVEEVRSSVKGLTEDKQVELLSDSIQTIEQAYVAIDELRVDSDINDKHFLSEAALNVPVDLNEGNLVTKQIDFNKQVNTWVESEIFPDLMEIDGELQQLEYSALLKLVNLKNRLAVIQSNPELIEEVSEVQFEKPLKAILTDADVLLQKITEKSSTAVEKINSNLNAQKVFDKEQFYLTSPARVLISDYQKEGNRWFNSLPIQRVKTWYNTFFDTYIAAGEEGITIENKHVKLIDFIKAKSLQGIDKFSHSLFLNKGYLGQTFYQPRSKFQLLFSKVIANWQEGFAASMLIHGKRLSGRSTIIEALPTNYNKLEYIELKPNTEVTYHGYKIDLGVSFVDIFKALDKYTLGERIIVTIDDLESWKSDEVAFLPIIKSLLQIISRNQKRYCFIVVTNNLMKQELDGALDFSNGFSSIFDSSETPVEDIVSIVETRADASTKESDNPEQTDKSWIASIAKKQQRNIGASLIEYTRKNKGEKRLDSFLFNKFIQEHRQVLEFVIKWGSISESEISNYKNPKLIEVINASVRQLVSMKILERQVDNSLVIPLYLLDEVEHSLDQYSPLNPH